MKRNDGPWRLAARDEDNKPVHAEGEKRFDELVVGDWFQRDIEAFDYCF